MQNIVGSNEKSGFILYFVTAYMRKYPIHVIPAQGTTQNTQCITRKTM